MGHLIVFNFTLSDVVKIYVNIYVRKNSLLQSALKSSYGIDSRLFQELMEQTSFCQRAAQCSINREAVLQEIKRSSIS